MTTISQQNNSEGKLELMNIQKEKLCPLRTCLNHSWSRWKWAEANVGEQRADRMTFETKYVVPLLYLL